MMWDLKVTALSVRSPLTKHEKMQPARTAGNAQRDNGAYGHLTYQMLGVLDTTLMEIVAGAVVTGEDMALEFSALLARRHGGLQLTCRRPHKS